MVKKFICDGMLGKLCKLLRMCGIDTLYTNQGMAILIEARKDNRIILTRNTHLRAKPNVFFMNTSDSTAQLKNVITHFKLHNNIECFSRCLDCNCKLTPVSKTSIRDKVPYFTYKNFTEFALCKNCQKVYWKGSHYKNMLQEVKDILDTQFL
jgi:uncharacterized protein with PIN domain